MTEVLAAVAFVFIVLYMLKASKYNAVIYSRNRLIVQLSEAQEKDRKLVEDIRLLVSDRQEDGAKSKQVYDQWRAEFDLLEKNEHPALE